MPDADRSVPSDPDAGLEVAATNVGGRTVLRVRGEIDEWTSSRLLLAVRQELPAAGGVSLDLSGVSFIGSAGLSALLQLHAHAERHRQPLEITAMSATVERAVELARLDHVLRIEAPPGGEPQGPDGPPGA